MTLVGLLLLINRFVAAGTGPYCSNSRGNFYIPFCHAAIGHRPRYLFVVAVALPGTVLSKSVLLDVTRQDGTKGRVQALKVSSLIDPSDTGEKG
jgi:hypothetical protein